MNKIIFALIGIFLLGWFSNSAYSNEFLEQPSLFTSNELISPHDRISNNQIFISENNILIKISGATLAGYADTNSMDPVLDNGATGIEIVPESENSIKVGDIISFESSWNSNLIVHRVIFIGEDELGWYCVTKGDNSRFTDPGKLRFNKVRYLLIGVLY
jgi:hypothetical protein